MWTTHNRKRYDRSRLRYPSDLTNDEWALVAPLIPPAKRGGAKRTVDVLRRRRLSGTEIPQRAANDLASPRNADRQAFRSEAIYGAAQALDRRAYPRLAQP